MKQTKIIYKGNVFNPTGLATANREIVKAMDKLGVKVQCPDPWSSEFDCSKGLERLNNAIDAKGADTIFADYPHTWTYGIGNIFGMFMHEGTKIFSEWVPMINKIDLLFVPSLATKNLFKWNGVTIPMEIVPLGVNPELYKPAEHPENEDFIFLSVNSWTGNEGDRKGTDLLIKAFDEEFGKDEKVKLVLKIGTFWQKNKNYLEDVIKILGKVNANILINSDYMPEEELVKSYQLSDCFVAPTRGEAFGMTIINAMATGLPVIVTNDRNSGHLDYCKGKDSVLLIDAPKSSQGDLKFYVPGNMLADPDLDSLKKQMRYAFENRKELKEKALKVSEEIRTEYTWENTAKKMIEVINGKRTD